MDFVHLHLHTGYSLADASLKPKQLAKRIKDLGMKSVAITDHGVLFGAIEFYKACMKEGVKPIIGIEIYVAPKTNRQKETKEDAVNHHLILLAKNEEGYRNLIELASDASLDGFYYKPRTDDSRLRRHSKGLIALSACIGGRIPSLLLDEKISNNYDVAKREALLYEDIFGKGNFYLELQNHGIESQIKVNTHLIRMSSETGIPLVCTNDCHYLEQKDFKAHDVLMAIQAKTTIHDTKRKAYASDQFYVKSPSEMYKLFAHIPEALENTVKIADMCDLTIEFGKNKMPDFHAPIGFTSFEYLKKLVYEGAEKLYGELTQEIVTRIEYEVNTVENMGFVNYFLIVWDFVRYARENNILVGPGRGSAAGSVMTYCLRITNLDPLKYGLLFERFLDTSRISMPDIDIDFQDDRRQEVIDYVVAKYGRKSVCQIITFGTMAARASIRAVGRALDYTYAICDTIAKMIPAEPGITLNKALLLNPDLKAKYDNDNDGSIKLLIDTAIALEGLPLYTGTHAAGVLITDELGVTAHVPVWKTDKGVVSQFHMGNLEELGLLKADFLGLSTLTVISDTIKWVRKNYGIDIDLDEIYTCKDPKPFELIREGYTEGLFQIEGAGMTHFMTELRPKNVEEVTAGISLYRPGPMQYISAFLANKRSSDKIRYPFEALKPVLNSTYGILVYQEQLMQAVIILAGYQKHHSDSFRKAVAKKKPELIAEHKMYFIEGREAGNGKDMIPGGIFAGYKREELENFYKEMEEFGKYCFNKSHAAAYAVIAYITAWCKYYYPAEFMAALMDSVIKNKSRVARYISHCKKDLGIDVTSPDIAISQERFVPLPGKKIVFSLAAKNVSMEAVKTICLMRGQSPLESIHDFFRRCYTIIDKQTLEAFVAVGAFRTFGVTKSQFMAAIEDISDALNKVKSAKKRAETPAKQSEPVDLIVSVDTSFHKFLKPRKVKEKKSFSFDERFSVENYLPDIKEYPKSIELRLEKEYLGLYLTGHPLDRYRFAIANFSDFKTSDIEYEINEDTGDIVLTSEGRKNDYEEVRFIAIVNTKLELTTKKKTLMGILEVEDLYGVCKVTVFSDQYAEIKSILKEDEIYQIRGRVSLKPGDIPSIICTSMNLASQVVTKRLILACTDAYMCKDMIKYIEGLKVFGKNPVYLQCGKTRVLLPRELWVEIDLFLRYVDRSFISQEQINIREW